MKHLKRPTSYLLTAIFAVTLCIGFGTGCNAARLETGGAYAQEGVQADLAFYQVDAAYKLAYGILDGAFAFEFENRDSLWSVSPDIKHSLDQIRPQAELWNGRYLEARAAYKAMPVPANLQPMQAALLKIQQLQATAQTFLPQPET